jgi:hypothetical protein
LIQNQQTLTIDDVCLNHSQIGQILSITTHLNLVAIKFGGHVRIEEGGVGQVENVELYRMGQTNVKGRYPMHFHMLGSCKTCYFRGSSIHRSFYRCIAIHGTNDSLTTENVAYDVIGFCYYMEDGVEENNTISFNLAVHIHTIGPDIPWGYGQTTSTYEEGPNLTLPADVTASGFYITNIHNFIIGNTASGVSLETEKKDSGLLRFFAKRICS